MRLRPFAWSVLPLVLAGCGSAPSVTLGFLPSPAPVTAPASITEADGLTPEDIDAEVIGSKIQVPDYQELQLAVVVIRDGAFSATDSFVTCFGSNKPQARTVRIIAFAPDGALRPGTQDTLVRVLGRSLRFSGRRTGNIHGHFGPSVLSPGQPYVTVATLVYPQMSTTSYSDDVGNTAGILFAVHLYARLVPIAAGNPYFHELQSSNHGSSYARDLPVKALEEIVPASAATPVPARAAHAVTF